MEFQTDRLREVPAVLIAGPTASGKSALALQLAEAAARAGRSALVVNADSMQVYGALRILSARPGAAEEMRAEHRLYGHVAAGCRYSAGAWLRDMRPLLAEAAGSGALPVIVGGTGLYFRVLTEGLAATPPVPEAVRRHWAGRLRAEGAAALHAELARRDAAAAAIRPADPQRILRALEVLDATGRPLSDWQAERSAALLAAEACVRVVLDGDRAELYRRIETRLDRMLSDGALDEVRALLALDLAPDLPVMKAIGVRPLAGFLQGRMPLEVALVQARTETRHYAKRQLTWMRNQMDGWQRLPAF